MELQEIRSTLTALKDKRFELRLMPCYKNKQRQIKAINIKIRNLTKKEKYKAAS